MDSSPISHIDSKQSGATSLDTAADLRFRHHGGKLTALQEEDLLHSKALTTTAEEAQGYLTSTQLVGSLAAISVAVLSTYWGFSPCVFPKSSKKLPHHHGSPAAVLTDINADIGPSPNASLFSLAWQLSGSVMNIFFGRMTDQFGRRPFALACSLIALVGGIVASRAQNFNTLIGANVLLGLGGGCPAMFGRYPLLCGELVPNKYKHAFTGAVVGLNIIPTGFGAYLAAYFVHHYSWRVLYYVFIGFQSLALILFFLFYRPPAFHQLHGKRRSYKQELKRVDYIGLILFTGGLTCFLLGLAWGGQPVPWDSAKILALLIVGGCVLIAFVLWELFANLEVPLLPMYLFKLKGFPTLVAVSSVASCGYIGSAIVWPSEVVAVFAGSITDWKTTAWMTTTIAFGIWGGICLIMPFSSHIGHHKWQISFAVAMAAAMAGGLSTVTPARKAAGIAFSFLYTFPTGYTETSCTLLVQLICPDIDLGIAVSALTMIRNSVGSVATAVYVAILNNKAPGELQKYVVPAVTQAGLPASSLPSLFQAIAGTLPYSQVPGITPAIQEAAVVSAGYGWASAYKYVSYTILAINLAGFITTLFLPDFDKFLTGHIARQVYARNHNKADDSSDAVVETKAQV